MQKILILVTLLAVLSACQNRPVQWKGPVLTQPRNQLTADELLEGKAQPLVDMSYFARPDWGETALAGFSGTLHITEAVLDFPKEKDHYPGEVNFPNLQLDFITHEGDLIPLVKRKISTRSQHKSYWDVVVGAGKVWHETEDGVWNRASFPLTLTDRWMGQARNCVATFVYQPGQVSPVCLQCSQETADIDDQQLGNIKGILPAGFEVHPFADSAQVVARHRQHISSRLPVYPLSNIDANHQVASYFEQMKRTNAPTSLGAVFLDGALYVHPPKTRHGRYPYPREMRHGLYSVTKSMAGALSLMYLEERYPEAVFNAKVADYVPALAQHSGWRGVTFGHALNMVTGTDGGEDAARLFHPLIAAETAEEAINNIAKLADAPEPPGQKFNYASTNLFVLSYAMQRYVEAKEGPSANYWELVRENVLAPIGAEYFTVLHTMEPEGIQPIPILAYGALPTLDEAAKIALLFANGGRYQGQQLLNRQRVREAFGATEWPGYSTYNDFRGAHYRHSFWSKPVETEKCTITATYMLGFGENYVIFLPSQTLIFRFLDEHDLNIDPLIKRVEQIKSSCGGG